MKILQLKFLVLLLTSIVLFTGCKDDTEEEVSPFVGNFVISNAQMLSINPAISTNEIGPISNDLIAGTDITALIQQSLLSQVTCDSPDNSWVELRKDNSMVMSCEGSNELDAGTWEEVSATELKLNMNSAAIPSSPAGFVLNVTNIIISGSTLTGETAVPLPKEMIAALVAQLGASIGQTLTLTANSPDNFMASFTITFVKQ
jgi:hypothetical protein